jgi:hypothetical protein
MELSQQQLAFFKDNGYLIVPGAISAEHCAEARDRMWAALPATCALKRDDPSTYTGPFKDQDIDHDPLHTRQGFRWQNREISTEAFFIEMTFSAELRAVAEQLIGKNTLREPVVGGQRMGSVGTAWPGGPVDPAINEGVRGIYCTLPYGDQPRLPDASHTDGHPFSLGAVANIHRVPVDGGAFKVWPKSHRRLYPTFQMQYDQPRIPYYDHLPSYKGIIHSAAYLKELEAIMHDTQPVECAGGEGDVVLWHHRLAHMAGHNYTDVIRQSVLWDYNRSDLDQLRADPPQHNMWRDWSEQLQANDSHYSDEFSREQRLSR